MSNAITPDDLLKAYHTLYDNDYIGRHIWTSEELYNSYMEKLPHYTILKDLAPRWNKFCKVKNQI